MATITVNELKSLLEASPALPVIDVRTPAEFDQVHATHAVNVPLDTLSPASLKAAVPAALEQPFYILCRSGTRADIAATKLESAGVARGVVVKGGTVAWKEAGFPVVEGTSRVISLERQVRVAAGALVLSGVLLAYLVHPYFIGLSAFVGAGLIFAGLTDWCGMGLLLAKAPWNQRRA
jgi:rhodanese-related sulfurtransferase